MNKRQRLNLLDPYVLEICAYLFKNGTIKASHASGLFDFPEIRAALRILDLGCGSGRFTLNFLSYRPSFLVGMDSCWEAIFFYKKMLSHCGMGGLSRNIHLQQASAEALPFRKASFDLLFARLVIPYTTNRKAISEVNRVLAPGGVAYFQLHGWKFYLRGIFNLVRRGRLQKGIYYGAVLLHGFIYMLTGLQMDLRIKGKTVREVFQSRRQFFALLQKNYFTIVWTNWGQSGIH